MRGIFLGLILLSSVIVFAQTAEDRVTAKDMLTDDVSFEEVFPFGDMKIFQDRQIVQEILSEFYTQQNMQVDLKTERPKVTEGIFSENDSGSFEKAMNKRMIQYNLDEKSFDELLKKADEDPSAAFKAFLLNSSITKIKSEEMQSLNKIDKKALSKITQMVTESGPDVGAKRVPVLYKDETQK